MKIARTENAIRNIVFGLILKIFQLVCPFIMRTVMINYLGVQYLGLNSLCVSILSVLNLAELGVGTAMVYCMYKPIAEDDTKKICALMHMYLLQNNRFIDRSFRFGIITVYTETYKRRNT